LDAAVIDRAGSDDHVARESASNVVRTEQIPTKDKEAEPPAADDEPAG
jgi:hypothetical protein